MLEIVDWGKHYENHRTRELRVMTWVPLPNKHDGDGYTQLLNHPNGAAHFGAWCALVELASRQHVGTSSAPHRRHVGTSSANSINSGKKFRDSAKYDSSDHPYGRGILMRETGEAHDPSSLERMTRIPISVWEEALPRLVTIGWIKGYTSSIKVPMHRRRSADAPPMPRRRGAGDRPMNGMEWNGMEIAADAACDDDLFPTSEEGKKELELYHAIEKSFLSKNDDTFTDYGKEGKAIKNLIKKARARAPDAPEVFAAQMIEAFWKLKNSGDKFYSSQPFIPSALNASGIWDRVLETLRDKSKSADPIAMKIAKGEIL